VKNWLALNCCLPSRRAAASLPNSLSVWPGFYKVRAKRVK
jgi:hypothetical protein